MLSRSQRPRSRRSLHVEPLTALGIAQHYIRDLVYGANDGIITTFAVVAGVTGGTLAPVTVLVLAYAVATVSWKFLEKPVLKSKWANKA